MKRSQIRIIKSFKGLSEDDGDGSVTKLRAREEHSKTTGLMSRTPVDERRGRRAGDEQCANLVSF